MIKKPFRQHKNITKLLYDLTNEQILIFDHIFDNIILCSGKSLSSIQRQSECLVDIIKNNNLENCQEIFNEYNFSKNTKRKIELRYGKTRLQDFENKLKNRPRPSVPFSVFDYKYWIKKGYSIEESKEKVKEIQKNISKKKNKNSYKNNSTKLKFSLKYWLNLGYTKEEAEILRKPYLLLTKNDLISLIEKYGEEVGRKKWIERCNKYRKTMYENLHNKRTGGFVSKESLKFFIPIYKFCRKMGIDRSDIYFGIKGSREFFIKDCMLEQNGGGFFDFCIPKLNIIIEYNGTFWHPRNPEDWKNPYVTFDDALLKDIYKKSLAKIRNMDYYIVWSDDNLKEKIDIFCDIIKEKYNDFR